MIFSRSGPSTFRGIPASGAENPARYRADLPFYSLLRSPQRDSTSVLWPFFTWIDDRGAKISRMAGAVSVCGHLRAARARPPRVSGRCSAGRTMTSLETDYYLWPLYRYDGIHADPLDYGRTRILLYCFVNKKEKNLETGALLHRVDLWPLFTYQQDFNGDQRLQILAPIEPWPAGTTVGVERSWSPLVVRLACRKTVRKRGTTSRSSVVESLSP